MDFKKYIQESERTMLDHGYRKNLLHAGEGVFTETGEFIDIYKRNFFYGKEVDVINAKEELGDNTWYLAIIVRMFKLEDEINNVLESKEYELSLEEQKAGIIDEDFMSDFQELMADISTRILSVRKCGEDLPEQYKTVLVEGIVVGFLCIREIARLLGFSLEEVLETNISKLRLRFPDKFTNENALNRDLDAERAILEV